MSLSPTGGLRRGTNEITYLLDASAALAIIFDEPGAARVAEVLPDACISSVNLSEVVAKMHDRSVSERDIELNLNDLDLDVVEFDEQLALRAAALRPLTRHLGLSLGDRACLATAQPGSLTVVTADRAWANPDLGISVELVR